MSLAVAGASKDTWRKEMDSLLALNPMSLNVSVLNLSLN